MVIKTHSFILGVNPLEGSDTLDSRIGTVHGFYPWGSALVMGKFNGGSVLGGLWMVFLWDPCRGGTGTGKSQCVQQGRFHWTTSVGKQTHFLCYMLYIEQWGFRFFMFQEHRERGPPILDDLDRHVCVEVSTT